MLELHGVSAGYPGGGQVLHDVSLHVAPGTCVALLGPNGAGKTTLLRTASRMLSLQAGTITFDGRDISHTPVARVTALGLCHVPEGRGIFPALTVSDNLALFAPGLARAERVERTLQSFPALDKRLGALAGTLSGGERQMLALSRILLTGPKLVLLDEVSMGLAPIVVDEVYAFIDRLAASGASMLIVEQYVERVMRVADHIYVMRNGAIRFSGRPADLTSEEDILGHYLGAALDEHADVPSAPHALTTEEESGT